MEWAGTFLARLKFQHHRDTPWYEVLEWGYAQWPTIKSLVIPGSKDEDDEGDPGTPLVIQGEKATGKGYWFTPTEWFWEAVVGPLVEGLESGDLEIFGLDITEKKNEKKKFSPTISLD